MKAKGFTLIELLVVIAILGVLVSALIVAINPTLQSQRARDAKRKADIRTIQSFLEQYRHDQNGYPPSSVSPYKLNAIACANGATTSGLTANGITYLTRIPCDPLSTNSYNAGNYYYYSPSPNSTYTLMACLENTKDTDPNKSATPPPSIPAGSGTCNAYYVVTNP